MLREIFGIINCTGRAVLQNRRRDKTTSVVRDEMWLVGEMALLGDFADLHFGFISSASLGGFQTLQI